MSDAPANWSVGLVLRLRNVIIVVGCWLLFRLPSLLLSLFAIFLCLPPPQLRRERRCLAKEWINSDSRDGFLFGERFRQGTDSLLQRIDP